MKHFEVDSASKVEIVCNNLFPCIPMVQGNTVVEYHNTECREK